MAWAPMYVQVDFQQYLLHAFHIHYHLKYLVMSRVLDNTPPITLIDITQPFMLLKRVLESVEVALIIYSSSLASLFGNHIRITFWDICYN